jgi:hypothetical protein
MSSGGATWHTGAPPGSTSDSTSIQMTLLAKTLGTTLAVAATFAACGAAATLALGSDPLAAGNAAVSSCGIGSLTASRTVDNSGFVTQVSVSGLPAACAGGTLSVTLVASGGGGIGSASGAVPAGGGTMSFSSFGATVPATSLAAYSFAVVGP